MKKISLVLIAISTIYSAQAQIGAKLGVKGGLNVASLTINGSSTGVDSKFGAHAGLLAHLHLSPQIGLQPELLYSGQGMKQVSGGVTYNWNLDYINLPIMLQYMFNNGFRLEAGPQFGFLVSGKIKDNGGVTDLGNDLKTTDVGLGFGLNYLSHSGLGIGGRYNLGLTNINETGVNELKNRVGQISVFYMFNHNHKAQSR
jgi:hypothetical protein